MLLRKLNILAIVTALTAAGCSGGNDETNNARQETPVTVTTATAGNNITAQGVTASGQVEASQTAAISTRVMGYITKVYVKTGDNVRQGQLLFTVNNTDILAKRAQADAAVTQAEAALASAQKDYDRFTTLYRQQSASAKELDNVTLQYNEAKAGVDAAKQMRNEVTAQLSYTNVTAPFSGVITQKMLDAGNMANPGMPVLAMEQSGNLQVSASIPETEIAGIQQGAQAIVSIKSVDATLTGSVTEISKSSQFTGGQYIIKISIPAAAQKGLYAGMYANVTIPVKNTGVIAGAPSAILVPLSSILHRDELAGIYTVSQNNRAVLRWLRLGKTFGDKVEVLAGLDQNERFIIQADGKLYSGAPVIISK
ncbi:MAG TPA: efflux RND transporter periplasmic adaptor subunit [Chitinophagaceae bacterium]|nr:efflux RND transporter periplasmic adaptor subunit [Chitinophagaceae bacterium]